MTPMLEQMSANASRLAQAEICVWVVVWSIRRRGEMDEKLDRTTLVVRWAVVCAGWLLASIPGPKFGPARGIAGILGFAFLCWPNFAYYLMRFLRRHRPGGAAHRELV
jgi:hypothetical protein